MRGAWRAAWRRANPGWAWLLVALPVLCQAADLSGWLSADPLYVLTGLSRLGWRTDGLLAGQPWIDGNAGGTLQALGGLAASQWLQLQVPWWNHFSGVGLPLAAEMQPAAFFLPFVLLLRLPHGIILLKISLQMVAGFATRALLRRLGLRPAAALLGGLLFQLNGTFAWFGDSPHLPVAFAPLLLLGIERARVAVGPAWQGFGLIALALAWSLVAGFPETAYLNGLLAAAWSLLRLAQGPARSRFSLRLLAGVVVGLALASPVLLAFGQLLGQAYLADHGGPSAFLQPANWAMLLFPHVLGPPLYGLVTGVSDAAYWWFMGGYLPVSLLFAALLGTLAGGPERGLRLLLAGWVALALARAGGAAGITAAFDSIPFVHDTLFFRYAAPSWELPCCLLAAWAFDRRDSLPRWAIGGGLALCGVVSGAALWAARHEMAILVTARPASVSYMLFAAAWALAGLTLLARGFMRRARWLAVAMVADAAGLFILPTLAGTRDRTLHDGIVAYARNHLGLQRAYGLGPISPNYGAWFGVATLNHLYLPVPLLWTDYVRAHLDPGADPVTFSGTIPPPREGAESRTDAVRLRSHAFAEAGVALVLVPAGSDPFRESHSTRPSGPAEARPVSQLQPLTLTIPAVLLQPGRIDSFALAAATYTGQADGQAILRMCVGETCRTAQRSLAAAQDNAMLWFSLDPPLATGAAPPVVTIGQAGGTHPFAVWLHGGEPDIAVSYAASEAPPALVYSDGFADAYALQAPAPYFDTAGACDVLPVDWQTVRVRCARPQQMVRRELAYPGWRVTLDRQSVPIGASGIFQAVAIPPGEHLVRFRYAPPFVGFAWAAAAVAAVSLVLSTGAGLRRRRPASAPLS